MRQWLWAVLLFLAACNVPSPTAKPTNVADSIFYGGTVLTLEANQKAVQAIAIRDEKIIATGTDKEILVLEGPETKVINLAGRTLMPGFVDAHTHLFNDVADYDTDLDGIQQIALEQGITSMGNMYTTPEFLAQMQSYHATGKLRMRTNLYLIHNTNCGESLGSWWTEFRPSFEAEEMLRISGVKVFADGGTCNLPALSYETSPGSGLGDLYLTGDEIAVIVKEAQKLDHQVAIHALGDRAIEAALDGIEAALAGKANSYRHRIEHNAVLRPELLPRYGKIGVVATIFASYPACTPFGSPSPAPYNEWEWAWPSLIEANPELHIAWHGDDPHVKPLSPILELYGFLTRQQALDDGTVCDSPAWIQDDKLSAEQALPMMTREAAYALFRDDEVGTLTTGSYADLIILSGNPLTDDPKTLLSTKVLVTMVGGDVEFCKSGSEDLCP